MSKNRIDFSDDYVDGTLLMEDRNSIVPGFTLATVQFSKRFPYSTLSTLSMVDPEADPRQLVPMEVAASTLVKNSEIEILTTSLHKNPGLPLSLLERYGAYFSDKNLSLSFGAPGYAISFSIPGWYEMVGRMPSKKQTENYWRKTFALRPNAHACQFGGPQYLYFMANVDGKKSHYITAAVDFFGLDNFAYQLARFGPNEAKCEAYLGYVPVNGKLVYYPNWNTSLQYGNINLHNLESVVLSI